MKWNAKYISITNNQVKIEISSVNYHLEEVIENKEFTIHDFTICAHLIGENNSDLKIIEDSAVPIILLENVDYWLKFSSCNSLVNSAQLFNKHFNSNLNLSRNVNEYRGIYNSNNYVGLLNLEALGILQSLIEVKTRKIDYDHDFNTLVTDISEFFQELLSRGSSFLETRFSKDETLSYDNVYYSQFAFIKNLLRPEHLPYWLDIILRRPQTRLKTESELDYIWNLEEIDTDDYLTAISEKSNIISNRNINGNPAVPLPLSMNSKNAIETIDIPENSFVKFFIETLYGILTELREVLEKKVDSTNKLLMEIDSAIETIDVYFNSPFFKNISTLKNVSYNSQVLQKKYPYNLVFNAYNQLFLASKLSIDFFDESFCLGQKDVPTLYEYWSFIKIIQCLNKKFGTAFNSSNWIAYNNKTLAVTLKGGRDHFIHYKLPNDVSLMVYYNKVYSSAKSIYYGRSFSHELEPDISIEMFIKQNLFGIIHFDAKYKVDLQRKYKIEDLNKMHAYKDGIMGTLGAYIVGPFQTYDIFNQEELGYSSINKVSFPSVGAVPLNITAGDKHQETEQILSIIDELIELGKNKPAYFVKEENIPYLGVQRIVGNIARGDNDEL